MDYKQVLKELAKVGFKISDIGTIAIAKVSVLDLPFKHALDAVAKELHQKPDSIKNAINREIRIFYSQKIQTDDWLKPIQGLEHLTAKELVDRIRVFIVPKTKLQRFYFTYGAEGHPFVGGWTVVQAENIALAIRIFNLFHPPKNYPYTNCCSIYEGQAFEKTNMLENGNYGARCHETITVTITEGDNK